MSTKFFDTKKSGIVKKKTMKTGVIAAAIIAVTTAAGIGGYKFMNSDERPQASTPSSSNTVNSVVSTNQQAPAPRSSNFSNLGFNSPEKSVSPKLGKHAKKHSKKLNAKHSKKKHGKHYAKHSKKKHGKHYAKHSKKKQKHKHLAKHKKKKNSHIRETAAR